MRDIQCGTKMSVSSNFASHLIDDLKLTLFWGFRTMNMIRYHNRSTKSSFLDHCKIYILID